MLKYLKKIGPVFLVFGAWFFTFLALFRASSGEKLIFPMMIVMDVVMIVFFIGTRDEMRGKVLRTWRKILVAGLVANLVGTVGFLQPVYPDVLKKVALYGWMVLPGFGYLQTWKGVEGKGTIYLFSGLTTLTGFLLFGLATEGVLTGYTSIGLNLVWVAQTSGLAFAAKENVKG